MCLSLCFMPVPALKQRQADHLCILRLHRSNQLRVWRGEDFSRLESLRSIWARSHQPSGLCVFNATICLCVVSALVTYVCECVRATQSKLASWLLKDQESHAVLNTQRPCCFLSNTAEPAGDGGCSLWVYLERVLSEENSAPCPLICMDFYGMCLHIHGSFVSLGCPRSRPHRGQIPKY